MHTHACLLGIMFIFHEIHALPFIFVQHEMLPTQRQGLIYHGISRCQGQIIMAILGLLPRMGLVCYHDDTTITSRSIPVNTCPPVLGLDLFENKSPVASSLIWPCRYFSTHDTAQCATLFSENLECQIESLISNQIPPSWGTKFPDMKNLVHCSNSCFPQSVKEMM